MIKHRGVSTARKIHRDNRVGRTVFSANPVERRHEIEGLLQARTVPMNEEDEIVWTGQQRQRIAWQMPGEIGRRPSERRRGKDNRRWWSNAIRLRGNHVPGHNRYAFDVHCEIILRIGCARHVHGTVWWVVFARDGNPPDVSACLVPAYSTRNLVSPVES